MGSNTSKSDDQQHLLQDTDDEPVLLFEEMNIVLIGYQKAGKNKIGNAILGKKAFTYWNTRAQQHYLKDDNTTFGRRITLIRVPGWSNDLSSEDPRQMSIRRVIKDSVKWFKDGPHAIIVVVKTNTTLEEETTETLEKLLGSNISEHTLVFSTDGENIVLATLHDHYVQRNQIIIHRCRKRYHFLKRCTCGRQNMELIETIENFIVNKNATYFYPPWKEPPSPELQAQQLVSLINRLNQKISAQTEYISKLQSDKQTKTKLRMIIGSKKKEIQQLQAVLRQKEEALTKMRNEVEMLRANQSDPVSSVQHERISQLEDEGRQRENKLRTVIEQNERLNEELEKNNEEIKTLKHENQELMNILSQKERQRMQIQTRKTTKSTKTKIELRQLPSTGVEFVDRHRTELIQRVLSVDPILDELLILIGDDKYSKIRLAQTNQDKMRELYVILDRGGQRLKEAFMKSLFKNEKCVVEDLTSK